MKKYLVIAILLISLLSSIGLMSCEPTPVGPPGAEASSLIPSANNTYNLGNATKMWKEVFVGSYLRSVGNASQGYITLPSTNTTLIGTDTTNELTNKTLNAAVGKGTWTASGTWTLPAFTLGGNVNMGGYELYGLNLIRSTATVYTYLDFGTGYEFLSKASGDNATVRLTINGGNEIVNATWVNTNQVGLKLGGALDANSQAITGVTYVGFTSARLSDVGAGDLRVKSLDGTTDASLSVYALSVNENIGMQTSGSKIATLESDNSTFGLYAYKSVGGYTKVADVVGESDSSVYFGLGATNQAKFYSTGNISFAGIPSSDPGVAGMLYYLSSDNIVRRSGG